jgi:hypothetical protein
VGFFPASAPHGLKDSVTRWFIGEEPHLSCAPALLARLPRAGGRPAAVGRADWPETDTFATLRARGCGSRAHEVDSGRIVYSARVGRSPPFAKPKTRFNREIPNPRPRFTNQTRSTRFCSQYTFSNIAASVAVNGNATTPRGFRSWRKAQAAESRKDSCCRAALRAWAREAIPSNSRSSRPKN